MAEHTILHLATLRTEAEDEGSVLLEPEQRELQTSGSRPYPFGTAAALPVVRCCGRFKSLGHTRDPDADYSTLTITWFQDEFALPLAEDVLSEIRALNWDAYAKDELY